MKMILLIDDEESIRKVFGFALSSAGYRVIECGCPVKGLELARRHLPDLILCDVYLPGGDGRTLLSSVRADPGLRGTQVVLMTGRPELVPLRRVMDQGADDFLEKPVSIEALLSCVETRLSRAQVHWRIEDQRLLALKVSMHSQLPHEFITPLAGILGLSELLKTDASMFSQEEVHDFYCDIHQSALRLHRTVRNYLLMLELQAAEPEGEPPELGFAAIKECVRNGADFVLQRHDRAKDLILDLQETALRVRADDLVRITEELLDNAFKFSRIGTPVVVRLSAAGILSVQDEGRGMTDEEIGRIGAFHQFDRQKHEQQGLGLGLALAQSLVVRNGGTCVVRRRPEAGIEVEVSFEKSKPAPWVDDTNSHAELTQSVA